MPQGRTWQVVGAAGAVLLVAAACWGLLRLSSSPSGASSVASHPSPRYVHTHLPTRAAQVEGKPSYGSASAPPEGAEVLGLSDGRRVALYYDHGTGLVEQRYSPQAGAWSRPRTLHATKTEPCPDITLKRFGGTVAAVADFARFCSEGEPPTESIAAVGTGDLDTWNVHLTERYDGWQKVTAADDGAKVTFAYTYSSPPGTTRLVWREGQGFSELLETPEDPGS